MVRGRGLSIASYSHLKLDQSLVVGYLKFEIEITSLIFFYCLYDFSLLLLLPNGKLYPNRHKEAIYHSSFGDVRTDFSQRLLMPSTFYMCPTQILFQIASL